MPWKESTLHLRRLEQDILWDQSLAASARDALLSITCLAYTSPSSHDQQPPSPFLERVNQSKIMPRAVSPRSESESERVFSKKQKKREESPVDDPMDEDGGDEAEAEEEAEEEEYEIEKILDSSKDVFTDVCFICWSWLQGSNLNVLTGGNGVFREMERVS